MKLKKKQTKFKCIICGKLTAGRIPQDNGQGDLTFYFPRRHKVDGKACEGNILEAEWVEV